MPSLHSSFQVGLDFIDYLGERKTKTDKNELRDIYNSEFRRNRNGIKDPTFSTIVYALVAFNKATAKRGKIYLNKQVRVFYGDQWRRPRKPKPVSVPAPVANGRSAPPPLAGAVPPRPATASRPASQPGSQAKRRLANKILQNLREHRSEFIADKGGIVITSDHDTVAGGRIQFAVDRLQEVRVVKMYVQNAGPDALNFTYYTALHRIRCFTLADERRVTRACPLLLHPGDRYEVEVQFIALHVGFFPATMVFEFKPNPIAKMKPFYIVRFLEAVARTKLTVELGPTSPYKPYQSSTYRPVDTMVEEGEPPERSVVQQLKLVVKVKEQKYPFHLKEIAKERLEDTEYLSPAARQQLPAVKALLESPLSFKSYAKRFQLLLHLEELQMEVDIRKYDMHNRAMSLDQRNKKLLILQVPGVAENRPSVLRGDHLRVTKAEDQDQPITVYKGYVHRVELESVKLGFSKKLVKSFLSNMKFNVEFTINRYPLNLQHRAVQLAISHRLGEVLFPTGSSAKAPPQPQIRLSLYDRKLENNPEQRAAVQNIVTGVSRPAPYLVFGPPGTGKTVTLVEAIKQVHKTDPLAHILACAPSNSASDLLCERVLEHVGPHLLYRLYASSRTPGTVPKSLQKCCNWDAAQDCFLFPCKETLMSYKIIVATLVTAGKLVTGGLPEGHFTHIFVDEAGHAAEPECIVGIAGLLHAQTGQLVLAGDPKQLGPVLRSPVAIQHGLGLSLLERLMRDNPLYQKDGKSGRLNQLFVTKLLRNYRSHPAILRIPNELFYDGELQVFANKELRNSYCSWEHLPSQGFPLIFHGVMGKDEREANSPSFFNVAEIQTLVDYLRKLLQTQGKKGLALLSPRDIGIIAPYRKQVEKIQKAIRSVRELSQLKDISELKVGSVEEFQGQERMVIMVSAVRSSINYVKMDKDFSIGFLTNEKRFNVAMTRAKALLIVVGNPIILNKDPTWERFISYCTEEKGYTGFDCADAEGESDVVTRLAALSIDVEPEVEQEESSIQQHVHPEWRSDL